MKRRITAKFIVLAVTTWASAAQCATRDLAAMHAQSILMAAKQANGGDAWDKIDSIQLNIAMHSAQINATYSAKVDRQHGREAMHFQVGSMEISRGWDGKQAWSVAPTGAVKAVTSKKEIAELRTVVYGDAYGIFFPDRMKASKRYVGQRRIDGNDYDVVRIKPEGGLPFDLWVNRKTSRIERQVATTGSPVQELVYLDFRSVDGVMIPFSQRTVDHATRKELDRSTVTSVQLNQSFTDADFAAPEKPVTVSHAGS